ncbi:hypothetical protein EDF66_11599 [Sphingobacterium sp. JUb20]|nr:hypothetical protein [Sphingobacterium sp. JUb21]TCQ99286.1 hypothetical protein EDF66_11599 [Sphingobacterium sp. JUb20]
MRVTPLFVTRILIKIIASYLFVYPKMTKKNLLNLTV